MNYSLWGHKVLDTTEQLTLSLFIYKLITDCGRATIDRSSTLPMLDQIFFPGGRDNVELSSEGQNQAGGTSLMVQWLRLHTPNAGGPSLIPDQGPRSHMQQLKSSHVEIKDPACCKEHWKSSIPQLRPGAAK